MNITIAHSLPDFRKSMVKIRQYIIDRFYIFLVKTIDLKTPKMSAEFRILNSIFHKLKLN